MLQCLPINFPTTIFGHFGTKFGVPETVGLRWRIDHDIFLGIEPWSAISKNARY
jgi:hypothetical protein